MIAPAQPREGLLSALKTVLEIVVVASFITTFIAQPFRIPSSSMAPTLRVGDFLLVNKQTSADTAPPLPATTIARGDIVVFHWPVDPDTFLVKRVIALPGDHLRLRHGRVWIDGQPLAEPYAFYAPSHPNTFRDEFPSLREADPNVEPAWWIALRHGIHAGEITVPPDQYFVLGDNRNNSEDSRYWGYVPRASIIGRPLLAYFALQPDPPPTSSLLDRLRFGWHSTRILR